MKKGQVLAHESGTAARVIAHAAWQRSRGRKPSMPFLAQNNPRKALQAAKIIATSNPMNRVAAAPGYLQWYIVLFEFVLSVRALAYYLAQQSYTRIFQSDATYY